MIDYIAGDIVKKYIISIVISIVITALAFAIAYYIPGKNYNDENNYYSGKNYNENNYYYCESSTSISLIDRKVVLIDSKAFVCGIKNAPFLSPSLECHKMINCAHRR